MKKIFLVVAAIYFVSQLHAQDSTVQSLGEVVLSASKYPRKQSETGKVITVISRQEIEQSGGRSLGELLNTIAGTNIIGSNNTPGTNLTVNVRGASAGNTLILIDGIPVNDPSVISNYYDLNFLDLSRVERIEVMKGGHSTLYGSDAVAGVINIITKKTSNKKFSLHGSLMGGSFHALKQSVGISGTLRPINYSIDYTHFRATGFSAAFDSMRSGTFDKDGINQHQFAGRLGFALTKKLTATLSGLYSIYDADLDASAFTDDRDFVVDNENKQAGLGLTYTHAKGEWKLNYNYNSAQRDYIDDSMHRSNSFAYFSRTHYLGKSHFVEMYNSWKWKQIELLAGTDFRYHEAEQTYSSIGDFGPYEAPPLSADMRQISPYASMVYRNGKLTLEAGGRWNEHSEYGSNFTFTLNPSILIGKTRFFANLYSAFKTPTLYQLFDPFAGNQELKPEESIVAEAGAALLEHSFLDLRVTTFYRKAKDAILYTFNPTTFESRYANVSEQINYGLELEAGYRVKSFQFSGNYTFTDGETKSAFDGTGSPLGKDTTYYNLYRIPKHAVHLKAGWQACRDFYTSLSLHAIGKREEFIYGSQPDMLDGYATIDLYGEYKVDDRIRVFLDLRNITNKEYFDIRGYNSKKFNFMIGASFGL